MATRRSKNDTAFGASVSHALAEANLTQVDLAQLTGNSVSYVNQTLTGLKTPSPEWVDIVANTLKLQADMKTKLHQSAAKDAGYKIDLDLTKE